MPPVWSDDLIIRGNRHVLGLKKDVLNRRIKRILDLHGKFIRNI